MRHLLFAIVLATGLTSCITKPTYITEVYLAEGATLNSTITSSKPMDVDTEAALNIPVSAIPEL